MADAGKFALTTVLSATAGIKVYPVGFPFLSSLHVRAKIDSVNEADFTITGSTLTFGGTVTIAGGEKIEIFRSSPNTTSTLLFQPTDVASLNALDLVSLVASLLYPFQELSDDVLRLGVVASFDLAGPFSVPTGLPAFTDPSTKIPVRIAQEILDVEDDITVNGLDVDLKAGIYGFTIGTLMTNGSGNANVECALTDSAGTEIHIASDPQKLANGLSGIVYLETTVTLFAPGSISLRARANTANVVVNAPHVMTIARLG